MEAKSTASELLAIYKPQRGERPLWDFPQGTLCQREVAAYELSDALGWDIVPLTVLRDGPLGIGACSGSSTTTPTSTTSRCSTTTATRFREFAWFDMVVNNTDRKGGHCLHDEANDVIVGIDHGLSFHEEWKLRTVIWEFAGERLPPEAADDVCRVVAELHDGPLARAPRRRCSTADELDASTAAPRCSSPAACRSPATGTAPPGPSSNGTLLASLGARTMAALPTPKREWGGLLALVDVDVVDGDDVLVLRLSTMCSSRGKSEIG